MTSMTELVQRIDEWLADDDQRLHNLDPMWTEDLLRDRRAALVREDHHFSFPVPGASPQERKE